MINTKITNKHKQIFPNMFVCLILFIFTVMYGCESEPPIQTEINQSVVSDKGELTGTVRPIEALVVLQRNGVDFRTTLADDQGKWNITELPTGDYSLYVVASEYFTDISRNDITVEAGQSLDIGKVELRPHTEAATIIGQVIDKTNSHPIPEIDVNIICVTGICAPINGITDSDGNFSIQLWSGLAGKVNIKTQDHHPTLVRVQPLPPKQTFDIGKIVLEKR